MRRSLIACSLFLANVGLLFLALYFLSDQSVSFIAPKKVMARATPSYSSYQQVLGTFSDEEIVYGDARPALVDNFLSRYHSPFAGTGQFIVDTADKYDLPYGLIPAIAQCESNVGKTAPEGSYNAWGYGIYGGKLTRFESWNEGITTVTKGLKYNYYDKGLTTPEEIMSKYTPSSNGSWATCLTKFLAQLN